MPITLFSSFSCCKYGVHPPSRWILFRHIFIIFILLTWWRERYVIYRYNTLRIQISKKVCSLLTNLRDQPVNKIAIHAIHLLYMYIKYTCIVNKILSNRETSKYRKLPASRITTGYTVVERVYFILAEEGQTAVSFFIESLTA